MSAGLLVDTSPGSAVARNAGSPVTRTEMPGVTTDPLPPALGRDHESREFVSRFGRDAHQNVTVERADAGERSHVVDLPEPGLEAAELSLDQIHDSRIVGRDRGDGERGERGTVVLVDGGRRGAARRRVVRELHRVADGGLGPGI